MLQPLDIQFKYDSHTLGPSLMRMEGISSLGIEVVFHQFGAPKSEIFSSTLSLLTISGMEASVNEDMGFDDLENLARHAL